MRSHIFLHCGKYLRIVPILLVYKFDSFSLSYLCKFEAFHLTKLGYINVFRYVCFLLNYGNVI